MTEYKLQLLEEYSVQKKWKNGLNLTEFTVFHLGYPR